jgi:hypothetical protein
MLTSNSSIDNCDVSRGGRPYFVATVIFSDFEMETIKRFMAHLNSLPAAEVDGMGDRLGGADDFDTTLGVAESLLKAYEKLVTKGK